MINCRHALPFLRKVDSSVMKWCSACGALLYPCKVGGQFYFDEVRNAIVTDFSRQKRETHIFLPTNHRLEHEHDFMDLIEHQQWCRICGAIRLRRRISRGIDFRWTYGLLFPECVIARRKILDEAGL